MKFRPYSTPRKQPNINSMIYPKGENHPSNVWMGGIVMNVPQPSNQPTPPTPSGQ